MKVLVINAIMYTSETKQIKKVSTIKDTMIYDLCLAFHEAGHEVTLYGGFPFKPAIEEKYPFEILWGQCKGQKLFMPHRLPFMPEIYKYIKTHKEKFDLIISSEVFSMSTLIAYSIAPQKVIAWHEIAKHNNMLKQIPSKIWYHIITPIFMKNIKVVARSKEAQEFIKLFCKNTQEEIIDHGVNLNLFCESKQKEKYFVVCSQLIRRKQIDGIINEFYQFLQKYDNTYKLYIIGSGDLEDKLKEQVKKLNIEKSVMFTGNLSHTQLLPILSKSQALLVNTVKDNNMISIVEAIAVGTPIVTTDIPLNASYIKANKLGVAKPKWTKEDLIEIVKNNEVYITNCLDYRNQLSTSKRVEQFMGLI